jgi:exopolyphosphatase/guanosine-5'-triphosphate,3'-diphosphate pyrophosphatase
MQSNPSLPPICAIDIGSNSVKMVIGDKNGILCEEVVQTRLGIGMDGGSELSAEAISHTEAALASFAVLATHYGATHRVAVATSALRDASNAKAAIERFSTALGGTARVIGGDEEAALVFAAASMDPEFSHFIDGTVVATDVGGGSTEVVVGESGWMSFHTSLQLGAVRLSDRHGILGDAVISGDQLAALDADIAAVCSGLPEVPPDTVVISSGGTAANLGGAVLKGKKHKMHGMLIDINDLQKLRDRLAALPLSERREHPGINPRRADVIVAGLSVQLGVMRVLGCRSLLLSLRGLRYGLLWSLLGEQAEG